MSVNLLPNNLKNREKSELKKAQKAQKNDIQMHKPVIDLNKKNIGKKEKKKVARKSSFFSFFSKKNNKSAQDQNKEFLGKAFDQKFEKLKNDQGKKDKNNQHVEKSEINNKIKQKDKILKIDKSDLKNSEQGIKYFRKEVEINGEKAKKEIQSFQDYKKIKTEKQKNKNNKKKNNNEIKSENLLKLTDKKKIKHSDSEINFISGDLIGSIKIKIKEKLFIMFFSLGLSVIILFSLYVLTSWYQCSVIDRINNIKNKIDENQSKINVYEERKDEIIKFQTKLKAIDYLIQNHIYNTNFFENLEKYTLPNVYYNNLNADAQGNVSISASTDSFASVAKQLIVFQQAEDFVELVEINSAQFNDSSTDKKLFVNFDINLKVKKDIFLK